MKALLLVLGLFCSLAANAQASKPIRVVIAFPPGAAHDLLGRILAAEFSKGFAPGSIAENKPGAGTVIATEFVAKAAPDGATILMVGFPFPLINSMFPSSKIDVLKDFVPVVNIASSPNALIVKGDSPYKTLAELLASAKAHPGKMTYASVGNGSSPHMGMELLKRMAGVDILNVPYKGSAPARTAMLGGEVHVMFDNLPNVVPSAKAGQLRVLAVTSPARSKLLPEAPTMAEAGLQDYVMDIWFGVAVPAGTPPAAVAALNKEINRIIAMPEVKGRLDGLGLDVVGGSAESFGKTIAADVTRWSAVVRDAGIKPQ